MGSDDLVSYAGGEIGLIPDTADRDEWPTCVLPRLHRDPGEGDLPPRPGMLAVLLARGPSVDPGRALGLGRGLDRALGLRSKSVVGLSV
jgi:hypothetical protein